MPQADKLELSPLPLGTGRSSSACSAFVDNAAHPALSTKAVPRKHVDVGIDALRSSTCADLSQTNITKLTNTGKVSWLSDPEVEPLLTSLCRPENPLASGPPLSKSPPVSGPPLGKRASKLMVSMTDVTDAALRLPVRMQPPARFLCSLDKKQTPAGDLSDVTTAALGAPLDPTHVRKWGYCAWRTHREHSRSWTCKRYGGRAWRVRRLARPQCDPEGHVQAAQPRRQRLGWGQFLI